MENSQVYKRVMSKVRDEGEKFWGLRGGERGNVEAGWMFVGF